jgi:sporadic carbohydrate cluster 2OG-Fe(II) oxygenase
MRLSDEFLAKGIVKIDVEDKAELDRLKYLFENECGNLDNWHSRHTANTFSLNDLRLAMINNLNRLFQPKYFSLARNTLHELVGNELVMQRNINLSIQLPDDDSSLLPIHCDTWSGDSPYEVVLWVPLVDCYGTKSMFFCDKEVSEKADISKFKDSEELFKAIEPHVTFMDCKYGEALIFTQNIMHGNRVNTTNETRWSLNSRFKSLWTPYADKKLGEFFEPIEIRAASRLGMQYELPRL